MVRSFTPLHEVTMFIDVFMGAWANEQLQQNSNEMWPEAFEEKRKFFEARCQGDDARAKLELGKHYLIQVGISLLESSTVAYWRSVQILRLTLEALKASGLPEADAALERFFERHPGMRAAVESRK